MQSEHYRRLTELLLTALDLDPELRPAFLDEACGTDDELRRQVEDLIVADNEAAESFLERPAAIALGIAGSAFDLDTDLNWDASPTFPENENPTRVLENRSQPSARREIGRYVLLRKLGEGGMGVVYLAEQREPVRRRVALKVIKLGMDTNQVVARFESERQALALMSHPNIAQVFDAGATSEGRPYFVMEYVEGVPITRYCDAHKLDPRQRLELFIQVCEGVQHAHHKGIIHRDIKPSNVLVMVRDDRPLPKIIDFGLAKATAPSLTEGTIFTEHGQVVGTLDYMSPEQAGVTQSDVDSRTDVYSLGVLLYELLVGAVPVQRSLRGTAGMLDIGSWVAESDLPRPSARLAGLGDEASAAALSRGTDVRTLLRRLRGDLDWITIKPLEKDRARRYSTPAELAADIRRHLQHEPVLAGPPSTIYRFRKFVRRNRVLAGATAAVAAVLLLGIAGTSIGLVRAERARQEAETQRGLASLEAEKAQALSDFLQKALTSPDPRLDGRDVRVVDVLDEAAGEIEEQFSAQPEIEAEVRAAIGRSYRGLGLFGEAEEQMVATLETRRRALGPTHPETLRSMSELALVRADRGELDSAAQLYREALELQTQTLGADHPDTLGTANDLANLLMDRSEYDEAETLLRRVLDSAGDNEEDWPTEILVTRANLAYLLQNQGQLDEAEAEYLAAIEGLQLRLGEKHPQVLDVMNNLATLLMETGRLDEAESIARQTLRLRREVLGDSHPWVLHSINNLAAILHGQGKLDEAEPLYREALESNRRLLGNDHPETLTAANNLAFLYEDRGQVAEAERLYRMVVERRMTVLGAEHQDTLIAMHNLAALLLGSGRLDEAERWSRLAVEGAHSALPKGHYLGAIFAGRLGVILTGLGEYDEAEDLLVTALSTLEKELGTDHPRTVQTRQQLATLHNLQ